MLGLLDELVAIIQDLVLYNEEDPMVWKLNSSWYDSELLLDGRMETKNGICHR
jgi:hypothetical protein